MATPKLYTPTWIKIILFPQLSGDGYSSPGELSCFCWENSFRFKVVKADYIGIDTVSLQRGINFNRDFSYFNIDSKATGIFSLFRYTGGNLFVFVGAGITIPLSYESKKNLVNSNVVLSSEYYKMVPDSYPTFFFDSNIISDVGIGVNYENVSLTSNILT